MPMEFLRELANKSLPCTVTEECEIDRLRVLRAAGYVAALLSAPGSENQMGRVLAITGAGRKVLLTSLPDGSEENLFYANMQNRHTADRLQESD